MAAEGGADSPQRPQRVDPDEATRVARSEAARYFDWVQFDRGLPYRAVATIRVGGLEPFRVHAADMIRELKFEILQNRPPSSVEGYFYHGPAGPQGLIIGERGLRFRGDWGERTFDSELLYLYYNVNEASLGQLADQNPNRTPDTRIWVDLIAEAGSVVTENFSNRFSGEIREITSVNPAGNSLEELPEAVLRALQAPPPAVKG